jgi:serine/threonine-protein kinase
MPDQASRLERLKVSLADRYTIERELGRGGLGMAFRATDRLDRPVALKLLHDRIVELLGPGPVLKELSIAARLNHPNILPILEAGEALETVFYTTPYVFGGSMDGLLTIKKAKKRRNPPVAEAE